MTECAEYDWARDNAAIARDIASGYLDLAQRHVVYKDGTVRSHHRTLNAACSYADTQGWTGACTIRDWRAEPPTLGPLFDAGFQAGYAKAKAEAIAAVDAIRLSRAD